MTGNGSFELRVELSGLCLFVTDGDRPKVAVLMPDARLKEGATLKALDNSDAKAHVGYLRFDLANLDSGAVGASLPASKDVTPSFEVVHLLDREEIQFGLDGEASTLDNKLRIPDFTRFADALELNPAHLQASPPAPLLARTFLRGGAVTSTMVEARKYEIAPLDPANAAFSEEYGSQTWWTRTVVGHALTLRLAKFDGSGVVEIPLRPTLDENGALAITIKLANLCAKNPLEWGSLEPSTIAAPDIDFKWLYTLLQKKTGATIVFPPADLPHPDPKWNAGEGILQDCFSGTISAKL